jgi:Ca2+-binding EF-hand superfamily protein
MDKATETLDLAKIRKGLQIEDEELLNKYLREIWADLSKRSTEESSKGINKITFNKYYDLPGIISERLFTVFDQDKDGVLSLSEFVNGMKMLFSQSETFDSLAKFMFNFYDFRSCGKIKKEDVRVVLSYVPLQKNDLESLNEGNIEIVEENFQDRVESQEQLFNILNIAFKNKNEINFEEYTNVVKNINSDIFILILMFLLEKKPFSRSTIKIYSSSVDPQKKNDVSKTPSMSQQQQVIASPSLNSRFLSPKLKKKSLMGGKKKISELLQIFYNYIPV